MRSLHTSPTFDIRDFGSFPRNHKKKRRNPYGISVSSLVAPNGFEPLTLRV